MSSVVQNPSRAPAQMLPLIVGALGGVAVALALMYSGLRLPWMAMRGSGDDDSRTAETSLPHDEHGHAGRDHAAHEAAEAIKLSPQARKNIALETSRLAARDFTRSVSVPGIVIERPGRSIVEVTAPLTGVVQEIFTVPGEAITGGQKLMEIRLMHEEVVQAQSALLRTVEELDVNAREIQRLKRVTAEGGVSGKTLLERLYEEQKQQAILRAQRQTLLLHGLNESQVEHIEQQRTLLQKITVYAPHSPEASAGLQLESLRVAQGQHVIAGDTLVVLTDHRELLIEGNAFERDTNEINRAATDNESITAVLQMGDESPRTISDLHILYVSSQVEVASRELHFYVVLPNEKLGERKTDEHRFFDWRYRTGQRMQLQVPVETWHDQFVLPLGAIAQEGPEAYVFAVNGDSFERRPVHVKFRDAVSAVIANDGSLFVGDEVAISGAQQLQLALKNKSGGAIDPHAGHQH